MPGSLGVGLRIGPSPEQHAEVRDQTCRVDQRFSYESPHPNPSAPCGGAGGLDQVAFGPAVFASSLA